MTLQEVREDLFKLYLLSKKESNKDGILYAQTKVMTAMYELEKILGIKSDKKGGKK